jgi:PAS domain S-box-containing protein
MNHAIGLTRAGDAWRRPIARLALLSILLLPAPGRAAAEPTRDVLVVNSYHRGYRWSDDILTGIEAALRESGRPVRIHYEFLDSKRHPAIMRQPELPALLRARYRQDSFAVVITCDDNATWFVDGVRDELFPGVPQVFCGVNELAPERLQGRPGITGVNEHADICPTLALMLRLHPGTQRLLAITDTTETGRGVRRELERCRATLPAGVTLEVLDRVSRDELRAAVTAAGTGTLILYTFFFLDREGRTFDVADNAALVVASAKVPVYTTWDFNQGFGMVGGRQVSGLSQGRAAGEMAAALLAGASVARLPVRLASPNRWIFEYPALIRFGIARAALPPECVITQEPEQFWWRYRYWIGGAVALVVFLTLVIAALALHLRLRRRTERILRESEERFKRMFVEAPLGIAIVDSRTAHFHLVNPAFSRITGRSVAELQRTDWVTITHPDDIPPNQERMTAMLAGKIPGFQLEKRYRHPDGHYFWVNITVAPMHVEEQAPPRHLLMVEDITGRKQAEEALRLSRESVENAADAVGISTPEGKHYYQNKAFDELFGTIGENPQESIYVDHGVGLEVFRTLIAGGQWTGEVKMYARDRRVLDILLRAYANKDKDGRITALVGIHTDITARRKLEEDLRQAAKMDAVGRLAGGVAHDFNNMLGAILGYTELVMDACPPGDPMQANLKQIELAALRSADLTRQLLAFARKQTIAPRVIDLNVTVEAMLKLLRRLIGENLELIWKPCTAAVWVRMDPAQLDQILANLCVNARDAIAGGGTITIETKTAVVERPVPGRVYIAPGAYVLLAVQDTGCGMDEETVAHIFEPFFTTKPRGEGTGLGLATVYGAVKQNHGYIDVASAPGRGTTFTVYLPREQPEESAGPAAGDAAARPTPAPGRETILLVEDEPVMLEMTALMLRNLGYVVLVAGTSAAALELAQQQSGRIDLLMTDVVMPGMNGHELAERLRPLRPGLKRLYMSGYTADVIAHHGVLDEGVQFIQKPFSMKALGEKLREVLGRGGAGGRC